MEYNNIFSDSNRQNSVCVYLGWNKFVPSRYTEAKSLHLACLKNLTHPPAGCFTIIWFVGCRVNGYRGLWLKVPAQTSPHLPSVRKRKRKRSDAVIYKSPYTSRNVKRTQWQHKHHKKFDYTAVANRLRTVIWSNYGHPSVVFNRFTILIYNLTLLNAILVIVYILPLFWQISWTFWKESSSISLISWTYRTALILCSWKLLATSLQTYWPSW